MHLSLRGFGGIVSLLVGLVGAEPAHAQNMNLIPNRKTTQNDNIYRFDQNSVWALQLKPNAVVHSPLLRLKDVAIPVENNPPWWDRVGNSIIAMMPVNEKEMVVERTRLSDALSRSNAIAQIEWSGELQTRVTYQRDPSPPNPVASGSSRTSSAQVALTSGQAAMMPTTSDQALKPAVEPVESLPPVSAAERERIIRFIHVAIDRYDTQLRAAYDITIAPDQDGLALLRDLRQIDSITWQVEPGEGTRMAEVAIRNQKQAVTASIEVQFASRPMIVVAKEGLRKGHVLGSEDVELAPAERNVSLKDTLTSLDDVVGLQVQNVLTKGKPILKNQIGPVMLVERGDLVEIRVVGGGITIATSARTLDRGAQGALIPVETLEPRKKLMARVAAPGVVEIITRPPRVQ